MPFKSKAQQKFMFTRKPELAKEFAKKTKDFKGLPEHASSASTDSLFKEDIPRPIKEGSFEFSRKKEYSEDNTLMGRLASRMAARDYIDKQNLGLGTKASKAAMQDDNIPRPIRVEGPSVKQGQKVELEHKKTLEEIEKKNLPLKEATKKIAEDHLKEDPKYYNKLKKLESK